MAKTSHDTRKNGKVIRSVSVDLPDREDDEDPITKNQLRYIKKLASNIEIEGGLENLGKWQASALIDQIKDQQEQLEDDIEEDRIQARESWVIKLGKYFVGALLVLLLFGYLTGQGR